VSIYEKRHLRKHRRLLPLQADEFRAAEHPSCQNKKKLMAMLVLLFSQKYITTPTIN